jgi:hypothetical protein
LYRVQCREADVQVVDRRHREPEDLILDRPDADPVEPDFQVEHDRQDRELVGLGSRGSIRVVRSADSISM